MDTLLLLYVSAFPLLLLLFILFFTVVCEIQDEPESIFAGSIFFTIISLLLTFCLANFVNLVIVLSMI